MTNKTSLPSTDKATEAMVEAAYDAFTRSFASKPIGTNNTRDDLRAALIAALSVPAPGTEGVKIKPLEWQNGKTETPFCVYAVSKGSDDDSEFWQMTVDYLGSTWARFDTRDEAEAEAKADYETRILSAMSGPAPGTGFDMLAHLVRQRKWSEATFGPGPRTKGVIDHIRKELAEIEADPADIAEWIDVTILALDGAWRAGHTPEQIVSALVAKQTKNEARNWPDWRTMSPDQAIEHVRAALTTGSKP